MLLERFTSIATAIFFSLFLHSLVIFFLVSEWEGDGKPRKISPPKYIQANLLHSDAITPKTSRVKPKKPKPKPKPKPKTKPKTKPSLTPPKKQKKIDQHKANKLKAEKKLELDGRNDKLTSSYSAYVMERIEANWNRPPSARRGMQAELIIKLVPTGQVVSVALVKSSGNKAFDRSAEQAVYKVDKFDKLQKLDIQIFEKSFRRLHLVFRPDDLRL